MSEIVCTCPFPDECPEGCRRLGFTSAAPTILMEAQGLIYGERESEYGPGHEEMARVAAVWSVLLDTPVSPRHAALCMSALKLVREARHHKRDNLVDGAGYLGLAERVVEGR